MITQRFRIPKMHCTSCVMLLEGVEDELPGIETIEASFQKQQMVVTYDETKVSPAAIVAAAQQEGYEAFPEEPEV